MTIRLNPWSFSPWTNKNPVIFYAEQIWLEYDIRLVQSNNLVDQAN